MNDIGGAAYTGREENSIDRTIGGTGTAFNATIKISDLSFFALHSKNTMRADHLTHAATDAGLLIKLQC